MAKPQKNGPCSNKDGLTLMMYLEKLEKEGKMPTRTKLVDIYRPKEFSELAGLKSVRAYFENKTLTSHSYIFFGNPGVGKTSVARILANKLNAEVTEINAADKTGVDHVRELIDVIDIVTLSGNPRLFLIDEAHKLSEAAQNAFLKPVEDELKRDYIIFCTTTKNKIIKTLLDRCTVINFPDQTTKELEELLYNVLRKTLNTIYGRELNKELNDPNEDYDFHKQIIPRIASLSNGSARVAVKLLDQYLITGEIPEHYLDEEDPQLYQLYLGLWKKEVSIGEVFNLAENINIEPEGLRIGLMNMFNSTLLKKAKEGKPSNSAQKSAQCIMTLSRSGILGDSSKKPLINALIFELKAILGDIYRTERTFER